jgi:hypothetical protein
MRRSTDSTPLSRIQAVEEATKRGRRVRAEHRRKNLPYRRDALNSAIAKINVAQAALRRDLGKMNWNIALERTYGERARAASRLAQAERRKLRKMANTHES